MSLESSIASIDTTFALHRAGEPFRRLKRALRVYEPFEALHLDWYCKPDGGEVFFDSSHPEISPWNNRFEFLRHRDAILNYADYFAVRKTASGELEVYTEDLSNNPGGEQNH